VCALCGYHAVGVLLLTCLVWVLVETQVVATQSYGAFVRLEGTDIDG
jgi:hypothetical protein